MKTSLTLLALITATAAPTAFAAELAGAKLPLFVQPDYLFAGFVVTVLLLIVLRDYAGSTKVPARAGTALRRLKSAHPLAA